MESHSQEMSRGNHPSFPEEEKTTYFAFERRMFPFLFDQGRHVLYCYIRQSTTITHRFDSRYHDDRFWYDQFAVMVNFCFEIINGINVENL